MSTGKRTTLYFAPEVLAALRLRAAADDRSVSEFVNEAVRAFLDENLTDQETCTKQLDAVYGAAGVHAGLDPVLADLQFMTLAKHADR